VSRLLAALLLLVSTAAGAFTLDPAMRCDGPVVVFDASIREIKGDHQPVVEDVVTRLRQYTRRLCGTSVEVREVRLPGALARDLVPAVLRSLEHEAPAVAIVFSPYADVEAGASAPELRDAYGRILAACDRARATCVLGGQQPVNALPPEATARQLEIEQAATREFPEHYLPTYRHFQSGLTSRNLMVRLDKGDGRVLSDRGHQLLFALLQKRLIALAPLKRP
jgi:hypothetical protein